MLLPATNVATGEHFEIELDEAALFTLAGSVAGVAAPMRREAFAEFLKVSLRTVDGMLAAGVPRIKIGAVILIEPAPALEWLRARTEGRAA